MLFFIIVLIFSCNNLVYCQSESDSKIILATQKSDVENVSDSIGSDINVNSKERLGKTPLIEAIESDRREIVQELLKAGAQVNQKTFMIIPGKYLSVFNFKTMQVCAGTALSLAIARRFHRISQMLIDAGADVNIMHITPKCSYFVLPLRLALYSGDRSDISMLLAAGADSSLLNYYDQIALSLKLKFDVDIKMLELGIMLFFILLIQFLVFFLCFFIWRRSKSITILPNVFIFSLAYSLVSIFSLFVGFCCMSPFGLDINQYVGYLVLLVVFLLFLLLSDKNLTLLRRSIRFGFLAFCKVIYFLALYALYFLHYFGLNRYIFTGGLFLYVGFIFLMLIMTFLGFAIDMIIVPLLLTTLGNSRDKVWLPVLMINAINSVIVWFFIHFWISGF